MWLVVEVPGCDRPRYRFMVAFNGDPMQGCLSAVYKGTEIEPNPIGWEEYQAKIVAGMLNNQLDNMGS